LNNQTTVSACLKSLVQQAQTTPAEIILVDASTDGTTDLVASNFQSVRVLRSAPGTLVPHLWRMGFDQAHGSIVAFTIAQCVPEGDWLQQIVSAHAAGVAGVGGPIEPPANGGGLDWALYFARYSAYFPPGVDGTIDEIPGDNAAYKRSALDRCQDSMRDGFWETLVHVQLRANGEKLAWDSRMRMTLASGASLGGVLGMRYRHGRHYGSTRPNNSFVTRLIRIASSPLIVPIFLVRITGRVRRQHPEWTSALIRSLPALLAILSAWTLGEITGYLLPQQSGL
jgi:glycosyltransferase involved in cell wall biosynthesis